MPETTALEITGLSVDYGKGRNATRALTDVSLTLAPGESLGLIGATGPGKTTLARAIVGLVPAAEGRIEIAGQDVTAFRPREWQPFRRSGVVQYVFQDPLRSLDPDWTIRESLAEPLLLRGGFTRAQIDERIREYLTRVHLDADLLDRFPGEISGGQRQRVALARGVITAPQVLLLDEPVSALDSANRVAILELLGELRSTGVALVFISHDLGSVAGVTDRVAVLYRGELVEQNATNEIVNRPRHPYTRLLMGSAPTLAAGSVDRDTRRELRAVLEASR